MSFILLVRNLVQFRCKFSREGATCQNPSDRVQSPHDVGKPLIYHCLSCGGTPCIRMPLKEDLFEGPTPDICLYDSTLEYKRPPALKRSLRNLSWKGRWQAVIGLSKKTLRSWTLSWLPCEVVPLLPNPRLLRPKTVSRYVVNHTYMCVCLCEKYKP